MAHTDRSGSIHLHIALVAQGGATFAYQSDMEAEMKKLLGDWASDSYKRYIDVSMEKRYDSMKAFVEALNNMTAEWTIYVILQITPPHKW